MILKTNVKRLRRELKDVLENQLSLQGLSGNSLKSNSSTQIERSVIQNLEAQLGLMKKERENAMQMWQSSLHIIAQLEQDLKVFRFFSLVIIFKPLVLVKLIILI
jgi:hypothetical protein